MLRKNLLKTSNLPLFLNQSMDHWEKHYITNKKETTKRINTNAKAKRFPSIQWSPMTIQGKPILVFLSLSHQAFLGCFPLTVPAATIFRESVYPLLMDRIYSCSAIIYCLLLRTRWQRIVYKGSDTLLMISSRRFNVALLVGSWNVFTRHRSHQFGYLRERVSIFHCCN